MLGLAKKFDDKCFVRIKKESEKNNLLSMKSERCCVKDVSCVQMIILLVDLQKALFGIETQITEKNYLLGGSI